MTSELKSADNISCSDRHHIRCGNHHMRRTIHQAEFRGGMDFVREHHRMALCGHLLDRPLDALLYVCWHRLDPAPDRDLRKPKKSRPTRSDDYRSGWSRHWFWLLGRYVLWHHRLERFGEHKVREHDFHSHRSQPDITQ
jgi:hypothetical protein